MSSTSHTRNTKRKDGRNRFEYYRNYHKTHERHDKEYNRKKYIRYEKEYSEKISEYKRKSGCILCGIKNPIVLQFHHRKLASKKYAISRMRMFPIESIMKEIKKCDVICSNCHLILHNGNKGKNNVSYKKH